MQLQIAKADHQIPLEEKVGVVWAREALRNLGIPFNISATAEASDFKFGTHLGFAKAHHKITSTGKVGMALG